jgi:hypothetical protein
MSASAPMSQAHSFGTREYGVDLRRRRLGHSFEKQHGIAIVGLLNDSEGYGVPASHLAVARQRSRAGEGGWRARPTLRSVVTVH